MAKQSTIKQIVAMAQRQAQAKIDRDETAIAIRCQMILAFSMLQCGLSEKTVERVRKMAQEVTCEKYNSLKEDGVADTWLHNQLRDNGIDFAEIPKEVSFDF